MEIKYNVTGTQRKRLVQLISEITGCKLEYLGAPTFAYRVDYFSIDRYGTLAFDDRADSEEIENLIEQLSDEGFTAESAEPDDETNVCISMPRSLFTDSALENLQHLLKAKGALIQKALGTGKLPIRIEDTKVCFPWFKGQATPEEITAYNQFIEKLCEMARNQKRVIVKEKPVENEKYAFRCFLLRLGFIGAEYKTTRRVLLQNLEGSAAFKGDARKPCKTDMDEMIADERLNLAVNGVTDSDEIAEALAEEQYLQAVNAAIESAASETGVSA